MEDYDYDNEEWKSDERQRRSPALIAGIAVALIVVVGVAIYLLMSRRTAPEPAASAAVEGTASAPELPAQPSPAVAPEPLPPLDESDGFVRGLLRPLTSHSGLAAALATSDLIRVFTVVVDNIAEGVNPRIHLLFLAPREGFAVIERDGAYFMDPQGFARYDALAGLFASLDTDGCASAYRQLRPLVDAAYRDLGYPRRHFDDTLRRAIDRLLATPEPLGPVQLQPRVATYEIADPELERLAPPQKQLLRMGPENARRVKAKLRELRSALGL